MRANVCDRGKFLAYGEHQPVFDNDWYLRRRRGFVLCPRYLYGNGPRLRFQWKRFAAVGVYLIGAQLIEQRLGVLKIGGIEAFGEPAVDFGEHRPRFVATALRCEQARE